MSRLTELIDIDGMKIKVAKERPLSNQGLGAILHKLYALEDIEEELGCPLEVVFKALINGIWYEDVANRMTHIGVRLDTENYDCEYLLREYDNTIRFLPRNYKKTWWLSESKEE